ncbi:MAG TPA: STAS domain-containing protein [Rubrobacteraceae bacterium]|nr:STAS domain-containing protein [Rubrobacteraceae bacterium]
MEKGTILHGIEVRHSRDGSVKIYLWGEFDLYSIDELRETLSSVASLRRPTTIDLSQVAFMDIQSTRELAVRSQLYAHHVTLLDPSWQVERSVTACKLDEWVHFEYPEEHPSRPILEKAS